MINGSRNKSKRKHCLDDEKTTSLISTPDCHFMTNSSTGWPSFGEYQSRKDHTIEGILGGMNYTFTFIFINNFLKLFLELFRTF